MNRATILPPHYRKNSFFTTTYRQTFTYWLGSIYIYPAYLLGWYLIIYPLNNRLLQASLSILAIVPLMLTLLAPLHWRGGLQKRELLIIGSIVISLTSYIYNDIDATIYSFFIVPFILYICLRLLSIRRYPLWSFIISISLVVIFAIVLLYVSSILMVVYLGFGLILIGYNLYKLASWILRSSVQSRIKIYQYELTRFGFTSFCSAILYVLFTQSLGSDLNVQEQYESVLQGIFALLLIIV